MIEEMKVEDLDEVLKIENDIFSSPWKKDFFEYEIKGNDLARVYVLKEDDEIVAYGGMWFLFENADITTLGVKRDKWHQGYGEKMLHYLIDVAKENGCEFMHLEVRVSNENAIKLYDKNGFMQTRIRKGYYDDNHEDAYDMVKAL